MVRVYCVTFLVTVTVLSPLIGSGFDDVTVAVSLTLVVPFGTETFTTSLMTKPVRPGRTGFTVGVVQVTVFPLRPHVDPVVRSLQPASVQDTMPEIALTKVVFTGTGVVTTTLLAWLPLRSSTKIL